MNAAILLVEGARNVSEIIAGINNPNNAPKLGETIAAEYAIKAYLKVAPIPVKDMEQLLVREIKDLASKGAEFNVQEAIKLVLTFI
jgi:hypothetical protein